MNELPLTNNFYHIMQISIGPVVLISGVGLLVLAITNQFGRVIDRARKLTNFSPYRRNANFEVNDNGFGFYFFYTTYSQDRETTYDIRTIIVSPWDKGGLAPNS